MRVFIFIDLINKNEHVTIQHNINIDNIDVSWKLQASDVVT